MKKVEQYIEEATQNIRDDRAIAADLLIDLIKHIKTEDTRHQAGLTAAKYLETLQRSNEQLVKIATLIQKKNSLNVGLSEEDKEDIYDLINETQGK